MAFLVVILFSFLYISFGPKSAIATTFDITEYNAIGDGMKDETALFVRAWNIVCADTSVRPTMIIPKHSKFLIHCVLFKGPCKAPNIVIKIFGDITAPTSLDGWNGCVGGHLITFASVQGLIVDGPGHIDGQGALWWGGGDIKPKGPTSEFPSMVLFESCNGLQLRRTKYVNSPNTYISIKDCHGVDLGNLNVRETAKFEKYNPYNAGIEISSSSHVNIHDCYIVTGADSVAISGEAYDINVTSNIFIAGEGISIGSFGRYVAYTAVEKVLVQSSQFFSTHTGVTIRTPPYARGYARSIVFENLQFIMVSNPIVIDQHYCSNMSNPDCPTSPSASTVQVSDVTYRNISGLSLSKQAITFNCVGLLNSCTGIVTNNVSLTTEGVFASCQNVHGNFIDTTPQIICN